jgi:outer membrane autotransporter protein
MKFIYERLHIKQFFAAFLVVTATFMHSTATSAQSAVTTASLGQYFKFDNTLYLGDWALLYISFPHGTARDLTPADFDMENIQIDWIRDDFTSENTYRLKVIRIGWDAAKISLRNGSINDVFGNSVTGSNVLSLAPYADDDDPDDVPPDESAPWLSVVDTIYRVANDENTTIVDGIRLATVDLMRWFDSGDTGFPEIQSWDSFYGEEGILDFQLLDGTPISAPHPFPIGDTTVLVRATNRNGFASEPEAVIYRISESTAVSASTPTISSQTTHDGTDFDLVVKFDGGLDGFARPTDFSITNGHVYECTSENSGEYFTHCRVQPKGANDITVSVKAGSLQTWAGNRSTASNTLTVIYAPEPSVAIDDTQDTIMSFQSARANQLLSNQTELTSFLSGGSDKTGLRARITNGRGSFDLASRTDGNLWGRISGSFTNGNNSSDYILATVGAHKRISSNLLVGAMVEFDQFEQTTASSTVEGTGWLFGPYLVAKHPTQPLFLEGRVLYGASSNDVSPYNTYTDSFKTKRALAHAKLSGEVDMGGFTLIPNGTLAYTKDTQRAYTDSLSNVIPSQSVSLLQGSAGLAFRKAFDVLGGDLTLTGGISAIFTETSTDGGTGNVVSEYEGERGKVDLGLNFVGDRGLEYSLGGYLDGIGASGYETIGVNAGLSLNF